MPVIATNTTAQNAANENASKVFFNTTTQASNAVSKASVQNNVSAQPTSTTSNNVQEASHNAVIPQKSTPSDISVPNQQAVGQIAEKGDLTLNRDTNQSVSLNANGQRVLTVRGVDNVTQKNDQTTVYSYDNGQIHQFDKNLNMTSGPSDHTILQNDGKGAIYISDGKPYQAQAYPEGYTRLTKTANGLELQKVPTRTVNTFTQDGKTNCVFPGRGISESVSSYRVNNDESVTVTLANGMQETLQNNWVKPVPTAISNNLNVEKKSDDDRNDLLAQASKTNNNQNNGTVLENGAGYQVIQKGSSIIVNYNSKQVVAYNNITNLKKDASGLTFNADNNGQYISLGVPKGVKDQNLLPVNTSETEQALLNSEKKNANALYLGKNNTAFSPLNETRHFDEIEKINNQYYYCNFGTGEAGEYCNGKFWGVDNNGSAMSPISNVKTAPNGNVTFTENGQNKTFTNNWLKLNNTSNNTKPSTTNSSPEAVSLVGVKAIYQDATGKQIGSWNGSANQDPVKTAENHLPAGYTFDKVISSKESTQTSMSNGEQETAKIYNVVIQVKSNTTTSSNKPADSTNKGTSTSSSNASSHSSSTSSNTSNSSSSLNASSNSGSGIAPATSGSKGTNISGNGSNSSTSDNNSNKNTQSLPDITSAENHASDNHETDETGNGPQSPASQSNTANTSAQGSTTTPASQSKPANSNNPSASTSANGENGSSAMAGGNSTTPGKTASDANNGSSNKGGQSQAQSQNGSKTTVSDNGNVKTESSSNSGTADSIAALEKKTGLPAAEIKKMLAIAEANGGKAQFQNEQQHVYHVGSQGQMVAEPAGSAVSAPVEEAAPAQSASAPVETASAASATSGSASSSAANSSNASNSNALPETGMTNEGIEFAATMLALTGIAMVKREYEK